MTDTNSATDDPNEIIDVEKYAKAGREVPPGRRYRIRIDKGYYDVSVPKMTGQEILALAGKTPATHMLSQKLRSGQVIPIKAEQSVDFTAPGIERFQTLALDPTEG